MLFFLTNSLTYIHLQCDALHFLFFNITNTQWSPQHHPTVKIQTIRFQPWHFKSWQNDLSESALVHIVASILNECHFHHALMGAFRIRVHHQTLQSWKSDMNHHCFRINDTGCKTTLTSQRKPTAGQLLYLPNTRAQTHTHTCSKAQRLGPIKMQDTVKSECAGLEWSQLGLGKHAHSLALITEALNLSYTLTHTKTHTNIQTEIQIHTPSPETKARLNYRPPDRTYLLKNGGLLAKDSFSC